VAGELTLVIEAREVEEQRSSLEDQLRHADRLATIGQLAAGVAHELNEPLVTVLGCAQLSRKTPGLPEQAKADYERIIAASLHARDVISKLKLFARRAPARKEESDLNEVVRDGLALLEEHVEKSGITLEARLDSELPTVVADRGQLHQVLINLIVNALQATEPGGRITVRTMPGEAAIVLVVQDTGSGMAEETLKHIFTPFFTTKEVDEGTGLGLSVVHGIVSAHGGTIQVKSRVGAGSRFEVRLPVTSAERTDPSGVDEIAQQ
jgi:signal transduction histidine kinase